MKILIVTQYFWPESFRINDLAVELKERGHEVEVLTGKPNYPKGDFYKGYSFFGKRNDEYKGVKVHRVPILPRGKGGSIRLALNYLSFVFSASLFIFMKREKYDVTFTFAISPITAVFPAILHKKLKRSKCHLWVQDLWPESVSAASSFKSGYILNQLEDMVKYIYDKVDMIHISSSGFRRSIEDKGDYRSKLLYLPNWAEDVYLNTSIISNDKYQKIIPKGFIVMFAGNIGEAQDFESILNAAELTRSNSDIKWVIVGDGRKREWVESEVNRRSLQNTVVLLGRYPVEEMPNMFVHADLMLMTLKDEEIFALTLPSKIQSYMAFGKPIASMMNGEGNNVIKDANCGYIAPASDYRTLAKNIIKAYNENPEALLKMGENGRKFYSEYFNKSRVIDNLLESFSLN